MIIMAKQNYYRVEIWSAGGVIKRKEIRDVLRIQHRYDGMREHITRLIIHKRDDNKLKLIDFTDLDIAIVTYLKVMSLEEIDNELISKVFFTNGELEEKSASKELSLGDMISEATTPKYVEIHGFQATSKEKMTTIRNVLKIQNYDTPTGKIKRIVYKEGDKFCFAEFPKEDFTFFYYYSTEKTLEEFDTEFAEQLKNKLKVNASKKGFSDIFDEDGKIDDDCFDYSEDKVNKKRPIKDNEIMFG